ncbi:MULTISPECIES: hypothetical protein [unclassified Microcoleus]|uniref:hypothetical protein n=1 Tax=unclassified Microcoleus TaxID=2642155 RepID=UPI002FD20199
MPQILLLIAAIATAKTIKKFYILIVVSQKTIKVLWHVAPSSVPNRQFKRTTAYQEVLYSLGSLPYSLGSIPSSFFLLPSSLFLLPSSFY